MRQCVPYGCQVHAALGAPVLHSARSELEHAVERPTNVDSIAMRSCFMRGCFCRGHAPRERVTRRASAADSSALVDST